MMPAVDLLVGALLCGAAGCAEPTEVSVLRPELTLQMPGLCGRIRFTITSATTVTPDYPDGNCQSNAPGLVATKFGTMTWSEANNRTLTIPVRVWNRSTSAIQLPIRMELPVSGKTVLIPFETPSSTMVPLNMDSTLASDRKLWLMGGTGTLAAGDSTAVRQLTFRIDAPVTKGQFWFVGAGEEINLVPAQAPELRPAWFDDDSSYSAPGKRGFLKGIVAVTFKAGTPQSARQQAIDLISGIVVGGHLGLSNEGDYWVKIFDDGSGTQVLAATRSLVALPQVSSAGPYVLWAPFLRRPDDGPRWNQTDWSLQAQQSGRNAIFEDLNLPLAWGCETGDSTIRVGVIDHDFASTVDLGGNLASPGSVPFDDSLSALQDHGYVSARFVAARGNNDTGTAGVMWRAKLDLLELSARANAALNDEYLVISKLKASAINGNRVSVLTWGIPDLPNTPLPFDSAVALRVTGRLAHALRETQASGLPLPLLIAAAGNDHRDAWFAGVAGLRDSFPHNVLVVGGAWEAFGPSPVTPAGPVRDRHPLSNHGRLVDIWAPYGPDTLPNAAGQEVRYEGTSLSAPLVAGIAGLLASFDPSLTASEIRQLLIDGASAGFGGSGVFRDGLGSTGKLANAYESLKLAAQKKGVPICGNRVRIVDLPGGSQQAVVIERGPAGNDSIPLATPQFGQRRMVSVAQGGRQIAVTNSFGTPSTTQSTEVFTLGAGGSWTSTVRSGHFMHVYLEQDTAYLRADFGGPSEKLYVTIGSTIAARHVSEKEVVAAAGAPSGPAFGDWSFQAPAVSPDGEWILFDWIRDGASCGTTSTEWAIYGVKLRGTPSPTQVYTTCSPHGINGEFTVPLSWRSDGGAFVTAREALDAQGALGAMTFRTYGLGGTSFTQSGSSVTVQGVLPKGLFWDPDQMTVRVSEFAMPIGPCNLVTRSAATFTVIGLPATGACDLYPVIGPNSVSGWYDQAAPGPAGVADQGLLGRTPIYGVRRPRSGATAAGN